MAKQFINIILGLRDNKACRKVEEFFEQYVIEHVGDIGVVECVFKKSEFDDAVRSGLYQLGIVMEKVDDTPIGQGTLRAWKQENSGMRIVLLMDNIRRSSPKSKGLYEKGYYDGLFISDFETPVMWELLKNSRTKEEAYQYYRLDDYHEYAKELPEKETNNTVDISKIEGVGVSVEEFSSSMPASDKLPLEDEGASKENIAVAKENMPVHITKTNQADEPISYLKEEAVEDSMPASVETVLQKGKGLKSTMKSKGSADKGKNDTILLQKGSSTVKGNIISKLSDKEYLRAYVDSATQDANYITKKKRQEFSPSVEMFRLCLEEYSFTKEATLNDVLLNSSKKDFFESEIFDFIESIEGISSDKEVAYDRFLSFVWGYDVLESLINMSGVTDIHVMGYDRIRIKKGTERMSTTLSFLSPKHYRRFVENLLKRNHGLFTWDDGDSRVYTDRFFSDKYVLQVGIYDAAFNSSGESEIIIRKYHQKKLTIPSMIGKKLTLEGAAVIVDAVRTGKGVLLCGPNGCGATTLMNAMLEYIPIDKNGIVLQKKDELVSNTHPEIIMKHPVLKTNERAGRTIEDLAHSALSMDVDYYILADAGMPEVLPLYRAASSGYIAWTTVKATSCQEALRSLVDMILVTESSLSRGVVSNVVATRFPVIVYMENRRVIDISIVDKNGYDCNTELFYLKKISI